MNKLLWICLGLAIGGPAGWFLRESTIETVRPAALLVFTDQLANPQTPYLSVTGSWVGANLANKINTVHILCNGEDKLCEMTQANVTAAGGTQYLTLHQQSFKISKVDRETVTAVENLPSLCIRQTLLIDRTAQAVSLVRTKINRE